MQRALIHRARPLWAPIRWLGLDLPMAKMALSAAVAWEVASWLGSGRPYFAPLAAVLASQATIAASLARGLQRSLGVAVGILLAYAAVHAVGVSVWSVGALVLAGMMLGRRLSLGPAAGPQAAVSALLVVTVGMHAPGYALARIVDTVIGSLTAVVVDAFLLPPDPTAAAASDARSLAAALARVWRRAARAFRVTGDPRPAAEAAWQQAITLQSMCDRHGERLEGAAAALRYSPLRARRLPALAQANQRHDALAAALRHSRGALRILSEHGRAMPTDAGTPICLCVAAALAGVAHRRSVSHETERRRIDRLDEMLQRMRRDAGGDAAMAFALELEELVEDLRRTQPPVATKFSSEQWS